MSKKLFTAIATLVGMVIGAGILGIPYVVAKAGFWTGVINIIILGISVLFLHLIIGEVSLRTKGNHQLTGYAAKYFGRKGKFVMTILFVLGMYGAMVAYIMKIGEFLSEIFSSYIGGNPAIYSLIFFVIGFTLVYLGLKTVGKSEILMVSFLLIVVIAIFAFSLPQINYNNLAELDFGKIFIPFGVVFFALMGTSAIPLMKEELKGNEKLMRNAIIAGCIIPIIVYLLFAFTVVGISGSATTEGAIIGLKGFLGYKMYIAGLVFGILTMSTSFLGIGIGIKEMYNFDFKLKKNLSSILACFVPLLIALSIILSKVDNAFFKVLDITGAIVYPLTGFMLVAIYWKAKKVGGRKPEYSLWNNKALGIIIITLFLIGMAYEILRIFGII